MSKRIGPKVKLEWIVAILDLHNIFLDCLQYNSLSVGPIQPLSPSTYLLNITLNIKIILRRFAINWVTDFES